MYCTHCGKELDENAKFCERCGAKVVRPNDKGNLSEAEEKVLLTDENSSFSQADDLPTDKANSKDLGNNSPSTEKSLAEETTSDSAVPSEQNTLKAAVASNRKRSRRHMPLILLVALVLALASSIAYAAYYVYTEIYLPQQEAQQQEEAAQLAETDNGYVAQGAVNEPEATGEPANVLQIAEILAMSPEDIPEYLESQGLTTVQHENGEAFPADVPSEYYVEESYTFWEIPYASEILTAIDPEGTTLPSKDDLSLLGSDEYAMPMGISIGDSIINTMHTIDKTTYFTDQELTNDTTPNSALIYLTFPDTPSDEQLVALAQICNLGSPLAISDTETIENNKARSSFAFDYKFAAGLVTIHNENYLWYISVDSSNRIGIGCIPEQTAKNFVVYIDLYDEDSWQNADNNTKALMLCQTLLQDSNTGNGSYRTNILTGKDEILYSTYDPITGTYSASQWVTGEEYQQLTGQSPETYGLVYEDGEWVQPQNTPGVGSLYTN